MERLLLSSLARAHAHGHTRTHTSWSRWEARRGATSELSPASLWISWKLFLLKVFPHVQLLIHPNSFFMCIQYSHTYTTHPTPLHTHTHTRHLHTHISFACINSYTDIHEHAPTHTERDINMQKHKHIPCVGLE